MDALALFILCCVLFPNKVGGPILAGLVKGYNKAMKEDKS